MDGFNLTFSCAGFVKDDEQTNIPFVAFLSVTVPINSLI